MRNIKKNALIRNNLPFYSSLASGIRTPKTAAQRRFVMVLKGVVAPRTEHEKAYLSYRMNLDEQHQLEVAAKANKKRASKTRSSNMRERNAQKLGASLSDKHARIESDLEDQRGRFRVRKIPQITAPRRGLGKKSQCEKDYICGALSGWTGGTAPYR